MSKTKFKPSVVELKKDRLYYWCQCGHSKTQPFCDGSHEAYFCEPKLVTVSEDKKVRLCNCKKSKDAPFCDGTHKEI